jgi:ribosomal protein S18 acetylase RimI-like enzyme
MPDPTITIREASTDDVAMVQAYMADLVSEQLDVIFRRDRPPSIEEEREFIGRFGAPTGNILLIAVDNGQVAGLLDFHAGIGQRAHAGDLGLAVAKPWRRNGVATALIAQILRTVKGRGFRRVGLEVFENNHSAIALYEKLGFVHEGRRVEAIQVEGRCIDLIQMAKLL